MNVDPSPSAQDDVRKKVDLIVYDLDGTLIDSADDIVRAVNHTLKELKLKPRTIEEVRTFIGEGVQSLVKKSLGEEQEIHFNKALMTLRAYYWDHLLDHTKCYPGVEDILNFFSKKKQAVVTNKPEKYSVKILEGLGILKFFSAVIGGDSVVTKKPSPEGVFRLLNDLKIKPDRALIVGDSAIDIETGKNAKILTCAVTYGLGNQEAILAAKPDFKISRIEKLKNLFSD